MNTVSTASNLADWPRERQQILKSVRSVLGKPPESAIELQVKTIEETEEFGYVRRRINYFVDEWNRLSAWLLIPDGAEDNPAIICMHRKVAQGKDEPAGLIGESMYAFAKRYAEQGYVTLAPDCITAGERISSGLPAYDTKNFYKEFPRTSALAKMLADHQKCIDILSGMREVDADRIGAIGHDLGGTNALLLAAFDDRVRACVASCAFVPFSADPDPDRWAAESGFVLMPKLRSAMKNETFPFDWDQLLALAAPNATLVITGLNDESMPHAKTCKKAVDQARTIYRLLGEPEALEQYEHKEGHTVTAESLDLADDWFERWL